MVRLERPLKPPVGYLEVYGAIGVLLLFVARFVPLARLPGWGCMLRRTTGLPCLSCGMTRSFDWFMRGRFLDSLAVNPLGFCLAIFAVVGVGYLVARPLRPPRLVFTFTESEERWTRIGAIALLVANWGYLIARTLLHRA